MLSRRELLPAAAAASLAPIAAAPAIARLNMDTDLWVRLCGERATIMRMVADTPLVDGNIPDEVAMPAWDRVADIDDELGASLPTSTEGIRMALDAFRSEYADGCMPSEGAIQATFNSVTALLDGGLA